jgi:hypothetical protein
MTATWEESTEHAAQKELREDVAKSRQHWRGTAELPLDAEQAHRELTDEQRVLRNSRPRNRRWRALEKLDREIDRLTQQHTDAGAQLQEAEAALARAPDEDARTLAGWIAGGERGERPQATIYERTRERDAARLHVEAIALELDRALERRLEHIERNRRKMLADARKDVEQIHRRVAEKIDELPSLREELVAARETLLWLAAYPERAEAWGFPTAVALGLQKPLKKTLGPGLGRIEYAWALAALREDAAALAEAYSREQKKQLGIPVERTPHDEAMWWDDEDYVRYRKEQLERARRLAEWQDSSKLAAEIRDERP